MGCVEDGGTQPLAVEWICILMCPYESAEELVIVINGGHLLPPLSLGIRTAYLQDRWRRMGSFAA